MLLFSDSCKLFDKISALANLYFHNLIQKYMIVLVQNKESTVPHRFKVANTAKSEILKELAKQDAHL